MNLRRTVQSFRTGLLQGRASKDMCFMVCYPLQGYLKMLGIEAELVDGEIKYSGFASGHYWLQLENGKIIDPTADQFSKPSGERMPEVYIGARPEWYFECG